MMHPMIAADTAAVLYVPALFGRKEQRRDIFERDSFNCRFEAFNRARAERPQNLQQLELQLLLLRPFDV